MHRRRLLSAAGTAVAGLLAGCSGGNDAGTDGETGTGGSAGTEASTETSGAAGTTAAESTNTGRPTTADQPTDDAPTGQPITGRPTTAATPPPPTATELRTGTDSGTTRTPTPDPRSTSTTGDSATVAFENGGSRVVVSGTIVARDGCRRAVLDSMQANAGTLVASIGTERDAGTDTMCTQALTPVDYRFVLTPDSPPDSVRVVHEGTGGRRRVTTVDRSN